MHNYSLQVQRRFSILQLVLYLEHTLLKYLCFFTFITANVLVEFIPFLKVVKVLDKNGD